MISCAPVDLSYEEMLDIDGGIGSTEVQLAAALCLCTLTPAAAVGFIFCHMQIRSLLKTA